MRFQTSPAFAADWAHLTRQERELFRRVIRERFHPACERYRDDPSSPWPSGLRVRDIEGARGIWEVTWSFAGPDGRATFEWVRLDGELAVRWRRIGGHEVFREP